MRLLDTSTGRFVEKDPEDTEYAILSHTWDKEGEQTYKQLRKIQKRYGIVLSECPWSRSYDSQHGLFLPQTLPADCQQSTTLPLAHIPCLIPRYRK